MLRCVMSESGPSRHGRHRAAMDEARGLRDHARPVRSANHVTPSARDGVVYCSVSRGEQGHALSRLEKKPSCDRDPRAKLIIIPNFSSNQWDGSLVSATISGFPGSPARPRNDPAHPYISNNHFRATGAQPTYQVADLSNPNIKPWRRRS
jgi:hypothetical protein